MQKITSNGNANHEDNSTTKLGNGRVNSNDNNDVDDDFERVPANDSSSNSSIAAAVAKPSSCDQHEEGSFAQLEQLAGPRTRLLNRLLKAVYVLQIVEIVGLCGISFIHNREHYRECI